MSAADIVAALEAAEEYTPLDLQLAAKDYNDVGNAERLVARAGASLKFVRESSWYAFDGARWCKATGDKRAELLAQETVKGIRAEFWALRDQGRREGEAEDEFKKRVATHFGWAIRSGFTPRIRGMIEQARSLLEIPAAALDVDSFKFNVGNGTLLLRPEERGGIELRAHDREDLITRVAPVAFDPQAACPMFHAFLARILPIAADRVFLQTWLGYSLTGDASEQRMVVLCGSGANGKSTLMEVVSAVLGDYSTGLPFTSLALDDRRQGAAASPDLARLPGVRMVRASEMKQNTRLDETMIKALTGGEPITVRHLNCPFFEFTPVFKLTLSTNHKPIIRGADTGIWRRLVLVPFTVEIPEAERDKTLALKLRGEAPGILNWLLDGLRLWFDHGLRVPDSLLVATGNYRADSDPLSGFLDVVVLRDPHSTVSAKELRAAYVAWCKANALDPVGETMFGRMMGERGYTKHRSGTVKYLGIAIAPDFQQGQAEADEGQF
ncbi:MAG: hypothetical protein IT562_08465 [Alphaproteobacteria bacterium]|nr:hypothetical protein [Alphaproteobacteria bacterium]